MIKKLLFGMALLSSMVACTDDYTDWANPQHNDQPATVQFGNGSVTEVPVINLGEVFDEQVQVAQVTAPTSSDASYSNASYRIVLNGIKSFEIGLDAMIPYSDLQDFVVGYYGKAPEERDIDAVVEQFPSNGTTAVKVTSGTFKVKVIPQAADIDAGGYYLVGSAIGGWDKAHAVKLNHSETNFWDDPNFTFSFTSTQVGEVMIVKAADIDAADLKAVGYGLNNGTLAQGATAIKVSEADKKYDFTMNAETMTASLALAPMELYMTGNRYDWGGTWLPLVPVNGSSDEYWKIIYLHEGEQFKFAPVADWKNDFGYNQATIKDVAGAGIVEDGGNCKATNAGWYLLHITNSSAEKIIEVLEPNVYLQGGTTADKWDATGAIESHKFTVPATDDGEFVSPAFVNSDELRMCVVLDGIDWWKTEFIISPENKIDYRGRGGDQYRVKVQAEQKAYLNFTTGTAEVK